MRSLVASILTLVLGASTGCSGGDADDGCRAVLCGVLPPAITFRVFDAADGGTVPGAHINGLSCAAQCPGRLLDGGLVEQAGTFDFTAAAPGYVELQLQVVVPAAAPVPGQCCGMPFVPQHRDVGLPRQ